MTFGAYLGMNVYFTVEDGLAPALYYTTGGDERTWPSPFRNLVDCGEPVDMAGDPSAARMRSEVW